MVNTKNDLQVISFRLNTHSAGFEDIYFYRSRDLDHVGVGQEFGYQIQNLRGRFHSRNVVDFLITDIFKKIVTFGPQVVTP